VNNDDLSKLATRRRDAASRAYSAASRLRYFYDEDDRAPARFLVGYEAEQLLTAFLDASESLAGILAVPSASEDFDGPDLDRLAELVASVGSAIERRRDSAKRARLIAKLADTRGRTVEEAAAYEAKAVAMLEAGDG
jgi:hypothetical protein